MCAFCCVFQRIFKLKSSHRATCRSWTLLHTLHVATHMREIDGNAPLFSHPWYKSRVAYFKIVCAPENTEEVIVHVCVECSPV